MSVRIKPITDHKSYEINGRTISKDPQGNWVYSCNLSLKELQAFIQYETIVIKNSRFKKHTKATYKG
ncbi:hypothetical protein [uncultured Flavobacterium sp.]|uniref:hypothetical protein n=1 Tax=uncultured Flavobacterium sp. TaxID=165435 RepID=UPI00293134D5|nr:hypothetical protein [uncultured Flavobacterium sp.]